MAKLRKISIKKKEHKTFVPLRSINYERRYFDLIMVPVRVAENSPFRIMA